MKLSDLKSKVAQIEQGEWLDDLIRFDGLKVKCRGAGNSDWQRVADRLGMDAPDPEKESVEQRIQRAARNRRTLVLEAGLVDWNLTNDDGSPIVFTREAAADILAMPVICEAIFAACVRVGVKRAEEIKVTGGNSESESRGT